MYIYFSHFFKKITKSRKLKNQKTFLYNHDNSLHVYRTLQKEQNT